MKIKLLIVCAMLLVVGAKANNMLVQNVTTTGNDPAAKTIQVQFDISWDNSWRDSINWDAAWVFIKFKDTNGIWQHVLLNQTGAVNGNGTADSVQVSNDKVGCWIYRTGIGSGTFNSNNIQLQWNYGSQGLNNVTGLEVRVFAVEMVYVPEGEFNVAKNFYVVPSYQLNGSFYAPGSNFPVINTRLSPTLNYSDGRVVSIRIKGDAGIDTNNNGVLDNTTYPTGFRAFYAYKYELSEQQYADFLNTLTASQINTLGVAGTGISLSNGQYFSSTPNKACGNSNPTNFFAYADWSGLRPMSVLEMNKASYGPLKPVFSDEPWMDGYPAWGTNYGPYIDLRNHTLKNVGSYSTSTSTRESSGASYYGLLDLTLNASEPLISLSAFSFTVTNGNGVISSTGTSDISTWKANDLFYWEQAGYQSFVQEYGFRYVRSAD